MTHTKTSLSLRTTYTPSSTTSSSSSASPVEERSSDSRGLKSSSSLPLSLDSSSSATSGGEAGEGGSSSRSLRRRPTSSKTESTSTSSSSSETIPFSVTKSVKSSSVPRSASSMTVERESSRKSLTDSDTSSSSHSSSASKTSLFGLMSEIFAFPNFLSSFAHSSIDRRRTMNHKSSVNCQQIVCVSLAIFVFLSVFTVPSVEGQRIVISGKTLRVAVARMYRRLSSFRRFVLPIEAPLLRPPAGPLEAVNRVVRLVVNRPRPISAPLLTSSPSRLAMILIPDRWRPLPRPFFS